MKIAKFRLSGLIDPKSPVPPTTNGPEEPMLQEHVNYIRGPDPVNQA